MQKQHRHPHSWLLKVVSLFLMTAWVSFSSGCIPQNSSVVDMPVSLLVDGRTETLNLPPGATVQDALDLAGVQLGSLDKITPAVYTQLASGAAVRVIRVREVFEVEEVTIPFERQVVQTESLIEGQQQILQAGVNGVQQITYRQVFEDENPGPRTIFKTTTLTPSMPEIFMVGVQAPFTALPISGILAYITSGNAWVMEGTTSSRRPLVNTADLDGRVFSLSPDSQWLLFTRRSNAEGEMNSLWMVNTRASNPQPVDLHINNIAHYAGWVPGDELTIAYSTVEPRQASPGWQANNDLHVRSVSRNGAKLEETQVLETNSGGTYGWWGTTYAWSPDGTHLAYARPDQVGIVDLEEGALQPLLTLLPYQTRQNWAWVPGISWSADGSYIYTVVHTPFAGREQDETSPAFDLIALDAGSQQINRLAAQSGMFAYPAAAPYNPGNQTWTAYLEAIFPEKSATSRYRLVLTTQNGGDKQVLYPDQGGVGLDPQQIHWGPGQPGSSAPWLAFLHQGNIHILDPISGEDHQVTGDRSVGMMDWND
jgi:hypothetical protein